MSSTTEVWVRMAVGVATLLLLDLAWVTLIARSRYARMVEDIQGGAPMRGSAGMGAIAYALMVLGLCIFVLADATTVSEAVVRGSVFGLVLYGVYDATAAAVLHKWDRSLAAADVLWGMTVYTLAAVAGVAAGASVGGG